MLQVLNLKSLGKLDLGKVAEALDTHLKRVSHDCLDRPGDSKPRKVTMEFTFVPILRADGACDETRCQIQVKSTVPAHRTRVYSMGLKANGSLVFNEDSLGSIDQGTLLPDDEED